MSKRKQIAIILGSLVAVIAIAVSSIWFTNYQRSSQTKSKQESINVSSLNRCGSARLSPGQATACMSQKINQILVNNPQQAAEIGSVDNYLNDNNDELSSLCHEVMHTAAREFVERQSINYNNVLNYLPRSNNSECAGGFIHGLMTNIKLENVRKGEQVCRQLNTKKQQYICMEGVGGGLRMLNETKQATVKPALDECRRSKLASECAQGVYHNYFMAASGKDRAVLPAETKGRASENSFFCKTQNREFAAECWYQLFLSQATEKASLAEIDYVLNRCLDVNSRLQGECNKASTTASLNFLNIVSECSKLSGPKSIDCISGSYLFQSEHQSLNQKQAVTIRYRSKPVQDIIAECIFMKSSKGQEQCSYWMAYRAGRSLNIQAKDIANVCQKLAIYQNLSSQCRSGMKSALNHRLS